MALEALLAELNPRQREAATLPPVHALILAGAGTGKTKTIIARAAHLIAGGTAPRRIQVLTFTRRAANEIVERVRVALGGRADGLQASTFHVWCLRMLRRAPQRFGVRDFTVIDRDDQVLLFRLIRGRPALATFPKAAALADIYSFMRNTRCDLGAALARKLPEAADLAAQLAPMVDEYARRKRERGYFDFDDILEVVVRRMEQSRDTRDWIAAQYDQLLVDEMQDTNPLQWALLEPLSRSVRLFCVGDDAQSIYAFRGADFQNVHHFRERVPDALVLKLEDSYRATQELLDLANWLLAHSPLNYDRRLTAVRGNGLRPQLLTFSNNDDAAEWITRDLMQRHAAGARRQDQLILVRSAYAARAIERALLERDIPYIFIGGSKLLESAHVRDLLTVLRISANPQDELAWRRFLQLWPGIGEKTAERMIALLLPMADLEQQMAYLNTVPKVSDDLTGLLWAATDRPNVASLLRIAVAELEALLSEQYHFEEWPRRRADFAYVIALAERHDSVQSFLEDYVLDPISQSEATAKMGADVVRISTVHSAKGTECDVCYVPDVSINAYPSHRAIGDPAEIEEERRVLYVALTRARNELILTRQQPYFGRYRPLIHDSTAADSDSADALHTPVDPLSAAYFLNQLPAALVDAVDYTPPPPPPPPPSSYQRWLEQRRQRMARAADGESDQSPNSESTTSPTDIPAAPTIDPQLLERSPLLAQAVERWSDIKAAVRLKNPTLQAILNVVRLIGAEEQTLVLAAPSIFHRTGITQAANREILEHVLTQLLNQPVTYRVEITPRSVQ